MAINVNRTSYSAKNARRFVAYFNTLLEQIKGSNTNSLLVPYTAFGGAQGSTILNRMSDALKFCRENDIQGNTDPGGNTYKKEDYEYLFAILKKRKESTGIRLSLIGTKPVAHANHNDISRHPSSVFDSMDDSTFGSLGLWKLLPEERHALEDWIKKRTNSSDVVHSTIDGTFIPPDENTFRLKNGEVWRHESFDDIGKYEVGPHITIICLKGTYLMYGNRLTGCVRVTPVISKLCGPRESDKNRPGHT